jgi:hypothetical protein
MMPAPRRPKGRPSRRVLLIRVSPPVKSGCVVGALTLGR